VFGRVELEGDVGGQTWCGWGGDGEWSRSVSCFTRPGSGARTDLALYGAPAGWFAPTYTPLRIFFDTTSKVQLETYHVRAHFTILLALPNVFLLFVLLPEGLEHLLPASVQHAHHDRIPPVLAHHPAKRKQPRLQLSSNSRR
jgi:hypothetical protein